MMCIMIIRIILMIMMIMIMIAIIMITILMIIIIILMLILGRPGPRLGGPQRGDPLAEAGGGG